MNIKTAKNAQMSVPTKLMKNEFAKSMKPSPIKLYNILGKKNKQHK